MDYSRDVILDPTEQNISSREHFRFCQFNGEKDLYFYKHRVYGGHFLKLTSATGEVSRKFLGRGLLERNIDSFNWDDDILDLLKELPPHVRDVIGV